MRMLIDSHCHIDGERFDADRNEVVERALKAGVGAMLNVGTGDPRSDDFRRAVAVAEKYDCVYASVGVHPHDAKLYDDEAEQHLIGLAKSSDKVIAWGEIGLDYYYDHSPRDVQREVFRRQIRAAKSLGLPIIVHSRDADDETVEILKMEFTPQAAYADKSVRAPCDDETVEILKMEFTPQAAYADKSVRAPCDDETVEILKMEFTPQAAYADKSVRAPCDDETVEILTEEYPEIADSGKLKADNQKPGIMHCFGGTAEMAKALMDIGFLISFAGNVTFKKAENLRDAARVVPLDKLLIETDCPFLTPVPHRGKRNEPGFVVHTAKFLADFYGIEFKELAEQTTKNFLELFGLSNRKAKPRNYTKEY